MKDVPVLKLLPKADRRIRNGHCWIYSNEIDVAKTPLKLIESGEQAVVLNAQDKFVCTAMINPHTLIAGRVISRREGNFLSEKLLKKRLLLARSLRDRLYEKPYYRMVYGDSDALPGLVIDRFDDSFIVQISTAGMDQFKAVIVDCLHNSLGAKRVIIKNDGKMREVEGLSSDVELSGPSIERLQVIENGTSMHCDPLGGQKTGWFYDHRENRNWARKLAKGKRVLDLYSYVGGWGVQMLDAGASSVTFVDASESAMAMARENAASVGGADAAVNFLQGDARAVLHQLLDANEKFDMVIVDPPALIPRRKDVPPGERAYQKINELALRLVDASSAEGGVLVSASCSMHLPAERLQLLCNQAARKNDRLLRQLYSGTQGPDHPVLPAVPETHYLDCFGFQVLQSY
ncbi:MAG: RlmI/RlmK family 23S rRNA methyltransferase [unclassified Hahellaceae]|nr:RlmI/RlmK family 23S rRNA methyltransferase [Hahellaceae bacterium]|tara:strand:+ start:11844 stop:13055 length:1212 start_codon:yes stop_codon:yes gene_type:complete